MKITKTIIVREQELLVSVGVHDHEKLGPQRMLISVEVEMDGGTDEDDLLGGTLDYDRLRDFIKAQEKTAHRELQETIARRILEYALAQPGALRATVETRKPDIFEDCAYVGVRLEAHD